MLRSRLSFRFFFFFQAEDGIRDVAVTGVQTCALPICTAIDLLPSLKVPEGRGFLRVSCTRTTPLLHPESALEIPRSAALCPARAARRHASIFSFQRFTSTSYAIEIGRASCRERV